MSGLSAFKDEVWPRPANQHTGSWPYSRLRRRQPQMSGRLLAAVPSTVWVAPFPPGRPIRPLQDADLTRCRPLPSPTLRGP